MNRCANIVCPHPTGGPVRRYCRNCHHYRRVHGVDRPLHMTQPWTWRCRACGTAKRGIHKYRWVCTRCWDRAYARRQKLRALGVVA